MKKINKLLLQLYKDRKQILSLSFLTYIAYSLHDLIITPEPGIVLASGMCIGGAMVVGAAVTAYSANKASKRASAAAAENNRLTAEISANQLAFQKEMQAKLDKQKEVYRSMEFVNPYAAVSNPFAGMENVYEDLTVNLQQAEFESQRFDQQQANIMGAMRGAAGGSGIAALAQTLVGAGALQSQRIAAGIGQQESLNQRMAAQGAATVQQMERQGASAQQMARLGGEQMLQQMEIDRQSTLLGINMGETAGANAALQSAYSNQVAAGASHTAALGQQAAALYGATGQIISSGISAYGMAKSPSDKRLKKNINKIGESPSGLNIYSFEYIDSKHGEGLFQGVMSDEIPQEAVSVIDGYDYVDYSKIDVNFKQI